MTGVRLQGKDCCLAGSWAKLVSHSVCWNAGDFSLEAGKASLHVSHCAGFTIPPRRSLYQQTLWKSGQSFSLSSTLHPGLGKVCLMSFSRLVLSSRREDPNIYLGKNRWEQPYLNVSLAGCPSPLFCCCSKSAGLYLVLTTCPRLPVDHLVVFDQKSSESLLDTKNLL